MGEFSSWAPAWPGPKLEGHTFELATGWAGFRDVWRATVAGWLRDWKQSGSVSVESDAPVRLKVLVLVLLAVNGGLCRLRYYLRTPGRDVVCSLNWSGGSLLFGDHMKVEGAPSAAQFRCDIWNEVFALGHSVRVRTRIETLAAIYRSELEAAGFVVATTLVRGQHFITAAIP